MITITSISITPKNLLKPFKQPLILFQKHNRLIHLLNCQIQIQSLIGTLSTSPFHLPLPTARRPPLPGTPQLPLSYNFGHIIHILLEICVFGHDPEKDALVQLQYLAVGQGAVLLTVPQAL